MNIWVIVGLVLSHVVAFGAGVVLHSTLISKVEALVIDLKMAVDNLASKLPKV